MNWRTGLIVLLLLGALASGWALMQQRRPAVQVTDSERPDYVLHAFELTSLDREGHESFTVSAPELVRRPGDETMDLRTPVFLLPNAEGGYWQVTSATGWISADQSELRLGGGVKVNSPQDDLRPVTMNTDSLRIFPRQNKATTDAVVTIVQPGSILRGRGFSVATDTKRYVLHSEVSSRYAPR